MKKASNKNSNRPARRVIRAWDVYLHGQLIDTVFYSADCNADYVRDSLVDHDGYDSGITVRKGK